MTGATKPASATPNLRSQAPRALAWLALPSLLAAAVACFCVSVTQGQLSQRPVAPQVRPQAGPAPPPARGILAWAWLPVVAYALAAYLVVNYVLPAGLSPEASLYVVQPLIWGGLAVMSMAFILLRGGGASLYSFRMLFIGSWAAAFQVAAYISIGLLYGFGYSPYAREPVHMAQNGVYLLALVAGIECARALTISTFYTRSPFLTIALASLFFGMLMVPAANFEQLTAGTEPALKALVVTIMPALAISITASYLAAIGGPLPAIIYGAGLLAFEWFSPILPSPEWTVDGFTSTFAPLVILLIARAAIAEQSRPPEGVKKFDVSAPWVVATMLVVTLLWFNTGLLGVKPDVVTGSSMEPAMHVGDVVITRPIDAKDVKVGDVVRFISGSTTVVHRVIEIQETPTGRVFVTQGDNNNIPDDPIVEEQVQGKVIFTIPDAGWIPIKLSNLLNSLR